MRQCGDEVVVPSRRRRNQLDRLRERRERRRVCLRHHRDIDVGSVRERLAPVAERAVRVEFLRLAECTDRLCVIEREHQSHALIEPCLRARVAGSGFQSHGPEIAVKHRRIGQGWFGRHRLERRRFGRRDDEIPKQRWRPTGRRRAVASVRKQRIEVGTAAQGRRRFQGEDAGRGDGERKSQALRCHVDSFAAHGVHGVVSAAVPPGPTLAQQPELMTVRSG